MTYFSRTAMIFVALSLNLMGCKQSPHKISDQLNTSPLAQYAMRAHFNCLPNNAAMIAAHRGTSKGQGLSENSLESLQALIRAGLLIAEIDVAKTKDGIHVLFHDGVLEDKSTGKGAIASKPWSDLKKYLLKDTEGRITSDKFTRFSDYLAYAKDKIYLEIDFKSSSKYETVIHEIRRADMQDRVILISYSEGQARKLARLAPEMMISLSIDNPRDIDQARSLGLSHNQIAAWTGRHPISKDLSHSLKSKTIPRLSFPPNNQIRQFIPRADIIVSDYAIKKGAFTGPLNMMDYKHCLSKFN